MSVVTVSWEQLPKIQTCDVQWLDEREVCPKVNQHAHGAPLPEDGEVFACPAYAAGNCKRAGAFVMCAFHDLTFDWKKARDWKRQPDGVLLYAPMRGMSRRNGRPARRPGAR